MISFIEIPAMRFVKSCEVSDGRGLLPLNDPPKEFPPQFLDEFKEYDEMSRLLPHYLYDRSLRKRLKKLPPIPYESLEGNFAKLALFRFLTFISAYAWAGCADNINARHARVIPENLAVPAAYLAAKFGVPPISTYDFYAKFNFELIDSAKPVQFKNLTLLQHFAIPPYDEDESGFILPHVEIEAEAGVGECAIPYAQEAACNNRRDAFINYMWLMEYSLSKMAETLKIIPSFCRKEVFNQHIRPWIFYFKNIEYKGVGFFPILKGESGAQSAAIESFIKALGIKHKHTSLVQHLKQLKKYRPSKEQFWLSAIERGPSIKKFVKKNKSDMAIKEVWEAVHEALINFRTEHYRLAIMYIKDQGRGKIATGGTHYEKFLPQLIKETKENMIL